MILARSVLLATAIVLALAVGNVQAAEHGGTAAVDPNAPVFLKMEALNVTVFDRGAAHGRISIELRIDVINKARTADVQKQMPRLYDGFLAAVTEYSGTRAAADRAPDLDYLMGRFQAYADTTVGAGVVKVLVHHSMRTL